MNKAKLRLSKAVPQSGMKTASLIGTCPNCGEAVELILSKRQLKAILKGMKCGTPAAAEKLAESILGRDKKGDLNF